MVAGATAKAYEHIIQGIFSGKFPLGSPLSEKEIGNLLGLSRSPVREAMKHLEAEGLVFHFPGRGTFVTDVTMRDLEEIFELRILLELHALRVACDYISDETLNNLIQDFMKLTSDSSPQQYYDANQKLHTTIIKHGGNTRLKRFYELLSAQITVVTHISSRNPEIINRSWEMHLSILKAMLSRDINLAESYLYQHLLEVREGTLKELAQPRPLK